MNVEEVFEYNDRELLESLAIAKVREKILGGNFLTRSDGRHNITILQNKQKKSEYWIFVNETSGIMYHMQMKGGKFGERSKTSANEASKMIIQLELSGWEKVDARGWTTKYKVPIIMGLAGVGTAATLGSAGLIPLAAILMPIVTTFMGVFSGMLGDTIKHPLTGSGV